MGENDNLSLRERIERGFAEQEAAENAEIQQEQSEQPVQEESNVPQEQPVQQEETAAAQPDQAPVQDDSMGLFSTQAPQAQPAQPDMTAQLMALVQSQQAELAQLRQQITAQGQAMNQQSQMAEKAIDNSMTQPAVEVVMPVLDTSTWDYMDDAGRQAATAEYNRQMGDYINGMVKNGISSAMAEIAPIRQDYEEKRRIAANDAAKTQLYGNPQFADFKENDDLMERIIGGAPGMEQMEPSQRYLIAGLAARGYRNNPAQLSAQQLVDMVRKNPDAMKMLDVQRAQDVAQKNASAPPVIPSSGMGTASAIPYESPKNMDDVKSRMARYFQ